MADGQNASATDGVDRPRKRLGIGRSIGYASGNFGKAIVWNTLELFLIFYLTDLVGLAPATAGLIVLISLVWDAVLDPLVGILADRVSTPIGRYGPFILIGAPLTALSFALVFILPTSVAGHGFSLTLTSLLLFRTAYTLIDLPHNALITSVSTNSAERSRLAAFRFVFSSLAVIAISLASFFVLSPDALSAQSERFRTFGLSIAVIASAVVTLSWWSVRRFDRNPASATWPGFVTQLAHASSFLRDRDGFAVISYAFASALFIGLFGKALNYFAKYELGEETLVSIGLTSMMIGQIVGALAFGRVSERLEKAQAVQIAGLCLVPAAALFYLVGSISPMGFALSSALIGLGAGGVFTLIWSLAPDMVDKVEAESGQRSEAAFFGLVIVTMKMAIGFSAFLFGTSLDAIGFVANTDQSESTLHALRLFMVTGPALGGLVTVLALSRYRLTHARHAAHLEQLAQHRRVQP